MDVKLSEYKVLIGKPKGKKPLGRRHIDWWIESKQECKVWIGLIWLKIEATGRLLFKW
jgi:hypothetical protein